MNRKIVRRILILTAVWLSAAALVYAAVQLQISNTATITLANTNLFAAIVGTTSPGTCSSTTGTYVDTGLSIAWGNVPQGSSEIQYVCLQNKGSASDTLSLSGVPSSTGVTLTSTFSPTTITSNGFSLLTLTLSASSTATTGAVPSFTLTIS